MKWLFLIVLLLVAVVGVMYFFPEINFRSMPKGLIDGKLSEDKPNWVSSYVSSHDSHYVAPLPVANLEKLSACITEKLPQVSLHESTAAYVLLYRQSQIFHFVDWVCIHTDGNVVSSATMGYSDLGKNRELVEEIRSLCH